MPASTTAAFIAVDWGTTSARAALVGRDGHVLESRQAPLGIQSVRDGRFAEALDALLGDWRTLDVPRMAAGMIGSRQGWVEAPYVSCPASVHDLAGRLARTPNGELVIVPGLVTRGDDGLPDVMRGEETQLAGAVADDEDVLAVLPGTHSKWAHVAGGRLAAFATFMTGELYAVLLAHSILGRLAQGTHEPAAPGPGFARGVRQGLAGGGLSHALFGARTLALVGELGGDEVADWLSGLLIGHEIAHARTWAAARRAMPERVRVIGTDALTGRYRAALSLAGLDAEAGPHDAAVRGLLRIARHAGWNFGTP
ncbi:MAG TPA: 2-dehydro-3-deoxygalactonokinase [Casimicrobiaceae bacterium]|nr:2-dehydro-3-deoxygalactonokinase [Casimicrobiaceae bacterium]